jgi:hypothetical protein
MFMEWLAVRMLIPNRSQCHQQALSTASCLLLFPKGMTFPEGATKLECMCIDKMDFGKTIQPMPICQLYQNTNPSFMFVRLWTQGVP